LVGPGGTWQAGKRSASRGSSGQSSH
jgi:hypothetical protein